jgi:hypothetical protein
VQDQWVGAGGPLAPADLAVEVGVPRKDIWQVTRSFGVSAGEAGARRPAPSLVPNLDKDPDPC